MSGKRSSIIKPEVGDTSWMDDGDCKGLDSDLWFPAPQEPAYEAKAICRTCPVKPDCLDYALRHHPAGIWAGTSERQRVRLRKQLRNQHLEIAR